VAIFGQEVQVTTEVTASFPNELMAEVDRIACQERRSRSELLCEAVRLYIEMCQSRRRPGDDPRVQQAVASQDTLA
jgi:metal-responsive CopG/Arc/MetJ family transcriptional regulator